MATEWPLMPKNTPQSATTVSPFRIAETIVLDCRIDVIDADVVVANLPSRGELHWRWRLGQPETRVESLRGKAQRHFCVRGRRHDCTIDGNKMTANDHEWQFNSRELKLE